MAVEERADRERHLKRNSGDKKVGKVGKERDGEKVDKARDGSGKKESGKWGTREKK